MASNLFEEGITLAEKYQNSHGLLNFGMFGFVDERKLPEADLQYLKKDKRGQIRKQCHLLHLVKQGEIQGLLQLETIIDERVRLAELYKLRNSAESSRKSAG